jgi:hypothetical protein
MKAERYLDLLRQISKIAERYPNTPPAERHLLREAILPLERRIVEECGFVGNGYEGECEARRRTVALVPQNLFSYPLSKREKILPLDPKKDKFVPRKKLAPQRAQQARNV